MKRIAFVMQLHKGCEAAYRKRHEVLWPELKSLLKTTGICEYSIFLHPESGQLFGFLKVVNEVTLASLPNEAVMKKWWSYMKDIMETNADESPVSIPLQEVFYLP
jgi:L-rhamnose mutarotase